MPKPIGIPMMFDGWDSTVFKPKDGKDRPGLYLEECSYQAAKYAVEHWHYSGVLPGSIFCPIGVWEESSFRGCIIWARGATVNIGKPYGLEMNQITELVRVALDHHDFQVSRALRVATAIVKRSFPDIRLAISFADTAKGHHGGIYQGAGWVYSGPSYATGFLINGIQVHRRSLGSLYGFGAQSYEWVRKNLDPNAENLRLAPKHKYLYPLDAAMRAQIEPLRKPYPKCVGSADGGTATVQVAGGGSIPTATLRDK